MRTLMMALMLSSCIPSVWASVVHLTDGRVVEGDIETQDSKSVKVNVDGVPMTYYADEIKDIDGKPLTVSPSVPAAVSRPSPSADLSAAPSDKKALILKLMEVTGARDRLVQSLDFMKKSFPPSVAKVMDKVINIDELLSKLIPVYDRNLSGQELQGLINFYNSDLGRKYILITPVIMKESMQAGQDYFKSKLADLKKAAAADTASTK